MNSGFKTGVIFGSIVGASVGVYIVNKMSPMQRIKARRNTKRAFANLKNGMNNLW